MVGVGRSSRVRGELGKTALAERITIVERLVAEVLPGIASGAIKPKLAKVFALEEADAAQQYVRAGKHFGKVVLKVPV